MFLALCLLLMTWVRANCNDGRVTLKTIPDHINLSIVTGSSAGFTQFLEPSDIVTITQPAVSNPTYTHLGTQKCRDTSKVGLLQVQPYLYKAAATTGTDRECVWPVAKEWSCESSTTAKSACAWNDILTKDCSNLCQNGGSISTEAEWNQCLTNSPPTLAELKTFCDLIGDDCIAVETSSQTATNIKFKSVAALNAYTVPSQFTGKYQKWTSGCQSDCKVTGLSSESSCPDCGCYVKDSSIPYTRIGTGYCRSSEGQPPPTFYRLTNELTTFG